MKCDICNGELEIQSGGRAVCTVCGTLYSAERLREKVGAAAPAPAKAAPAKSKFNKELRRASAALKREAYDEAFSICDSILQKDYYDLGAWRIKIRAVYAEFCHRGSASSWLEEICSAIDDPQKRSEFASEMAQMFIDDARYNEHTPTIARNLCCIDPKLAERYIGAAIDGQMSTLKRTHSDIIDDLQRMKREADSDLRWASLMGQNWNRYSNRMVETLKYTEEIWNYCANECQIANHLKKITDLHSDTIKKVSQIMSTGRNIAEITQSVSWLNSKIEAKAKEEQEKAEQERREAVQKYWKENSSVREQLQKQLDDANIRVNDLKRSIETSVGALRYQKAKKEIDELTEAMEEVGFFEFKRKKELRQRLDELNIELIRAQDDYEHDKKEITKEIEREQSLVNVLASRIYNPLG